MPIAALIWLFEWFTDFETAWRLAAIVWPTLLAVATVWVLVLICDQLIDRYNRLLPLLFSVLCTSSIAEFVPGRVDHHNVQILLFTLVVLGLVLRPALKGDVLIGACIALSIAIGLDAAIVLVPILAYVGFEWAWGTDPAWPGPSPGWPCHGGISPGSLCDQLPAGKLVVSPMRCEFAVLSGRSGSGRCCVPGPVWHFQMD